MSEDAPKNCSERKPRWSPIQKPQWEPKPEIHREIVDNSSRPIYDKYEHPKQQRAKLVCKRKIVRLVERHPVHKPKFESHPETKPQLRPKVRPKLMDAKLRVTTPVKTKVNVEPKVSPKTKEQDEESTKDVETTKIEQGPPSDEVAVDTLAPGGHYELSPLMSRMLETELQDIMIKVWQELPDNPTSEAEKLVVNKLRNKAGDDLRNVFGLNVSQRLLNVFNMLYIKMRFTSNPEGHELTRFLLKNNITNFKWNNVKPLTYNAVVKNIKDFDRLCANQSYTIGNVKVIISPLYPFTKCPLKLRTSYHISNTTSKNATKAESSDQSNSSSEVSKTKPEESPSKTNETKSADTKPAKEKVIEKPPPVVKETAKPEVNPKEQPKSGVKPANNANKTVEKPNIKKVEKKPIEKREVKKEPVKKPVDKKPKASSKNIILQAGNDYDELNDDEIMALVSQGIILDQCSGSDDD